MKTELVGFVISCLFEIFCKLIGDPKPGHPLQIASWKFYLKINIVIAEI